MNQALLIGIVFVGTGFLFTVVFVAVIRKINASLHARELEEWAVLVRRDGAELRPVSVTKGCTDPNCGFATLHRIWATLDNAHELYRKPRSDLGWERGKVLGRPALNQLIQEARAWVKNLRPRYPQLLPILNVTLSAEDITFRDYLVLHRQVRTAILPFLSGATADAFGPTLPDNRVRPRADARGWNLEHNGCRDAFIQFVDKSAPRGEELWMVYTIGPIYLSRFERQTDEAT
jgi:hypothetical protein